VKVQVIERATGARLSHTISGQVMGTTVFQSEKDATDWMKENNLSERDYSIESLTGC
jgi:hypothetical protein